MSYLVLARRFRPQTFDEIVGQEHVTQTLKNAILSDRVAHAFLFAGARGVGKTTAARVLAKALNCVNGPTTEPCGVCDQCQGIADSRSVDVQEIDGASNNSVEDVRALRETVPYRPASGKFKIYIVDEVHMLSTSAFNALLKTLEEPPPHVKFVFATTEAHKIPVTILSRCQRYDFRLIPTGLIHERLQEITSNEKVEADEPAIALLAREAEGSMRDALSLLDQALAFDSERLEASEVARFLGVADRQLLVQISAGLLEGDAASALRAVETAATFGCDLTRFSHDLLRHLRNMVVTGQCPDEPDLVDVSDIERKELAEQVAGHDVSELHRLFMLFSKASEEIARSPQPRMLLEMTLARLASLEPVISLVELARRLESLSFGSSGGPASGGGLPSRPRRPKPQGRSIQRAAPAFQKPEQKAPRAAATPAEPASRPHPPTEKGVPTPRDVGDEGVSSPRSVPRPAASSPQPPGSVGEPPAVENQTGGGKGSDWKALLSHIERASPSLYHIFRFAEPLEVSPSLVRLTLPDEPFFKEVAESAQRRRALAVACKPILGSEPEVKLGVKRAPGKSAIERDHIEQAAKKQDRQREVTDHAVVRATLREFEGAQIRQIKLYDKEDEEER